jgi:hypothetical protein
LPGGGGINNKQVQNSTAMIYKSGTHNVRPHVDVKRFKYFVLWQQISFNYSFFVSDEDKKYEMLVYVPYASAIAIIASIYILQ